MGDSAYTGPAAVLSVCAPRARDFINRRARTDEMRATNRWKSHVRARVEHPPVFDLDLVLSSPATSFIINNKDIKLIAGSPCTISGVSSTGCRADISSIDQLITQVPEPASLLLLGTGLVAGALGRKQFFGLG